MFAKWVHVSRTGLQKSLLQMKIRIREKKKKEEEEEGQNSRVKGGAEFRAECRFQKYLINTRLIKIDYRWNKSVM